MTSQAKISISVSILLHVFAFMVFAGVKIYSELAVESEMGVEFVNLKKERPMRRSAAVRPAMSIKQVKQDISREQAVVRPRHTSDVVYYTDAPQVEFSAVRAVDQIAPSRPSAMHRSMGRIGHQAVVPMQMSIAKPGTSFIQMEQKVSRERDLVPDIKPTHNVVDMTGILQRFADAVRRRVESKKRYPLAAQRAGISGEVSVRLTISRDGSLEGVLIAETSGYEILDKAAIGSVNRATPFPPIPEESGKDRIHLTIQLLFSIA